MRLAWTRKKRSIQLSTLKPVGAKLLKMKNLKQNKTGSLSEQIKVDGMKRKLIP